MLICVHSLTYVATHLYNLARFATRASILVTCIQLFSVNQRARSLITVLVLGVVIFISNLIVLALECQPWDYIWLGWDGEHTGHCINEAAMYYAANGIGMVYGVFVIYVPIPYVLGLKLERRRKILVASMFSVGLW